jgi:hypothetical protein
VPSYTDALRGYAHTVLKRDRFTWRYCGLDGSIWPNWLYLSWNHLLPVGDPLRNDPIHIVAALRFCNEASNRAKWSVEGKSADEPMHRKCCPPTACIGMRVSRSTP